MLLSIDTGKLVETLPHKRDFERWRKNISDIFLQKAHEYFLQMLLFVLVLTIPSINYTRVEMKDASSPIWTENVVCSESFVTNSKMRIMFTADR